MSQKGRESKTLLWLERERKFARDAQTSFAILETIYLAKNRGGKKFSPDEENAHDRAIQCLINYISGACALDATNLTTHRREMSVKFRNLIALHKRAHLYLESSCI